MSYTKICDISIGKEWDLEAHIDEADEFDDNKIRSFLAYAVVPAAIFAIFVSALYSLVTGNYSVIFATGPAIFVVIVMIVAYYFKTPTK